ncbi:hypothetical protein ADU59_21245 [Pararhizobium polonicum]|uniref:Uncharacterized protein n=1 Tax=Pararhizobium polonicum TaxID=1612624 RepID=A0A1C7P142_9HYPH|nr:hypothetical protein ADU59_21245 [Pararhizobium polonicum]
MFNDFPLSFHHISDTLSYSRLLLPENDLFEALYGSFFAVGFVRLVIESGKAVIARPPESWRRSPIHSKPICKRRKPRYRLSQRGDLYLE